MKQSTEMYAASGGLLAWLLLRNTIPTAGGCFVPVFDAAWAIVGIYLTFSLVAALR